MRTPVPPRVPILTKRPIDSHVPGAVRRLSNGTGSERGTTDTDSVQYPRAFGLLNVPGAIRLAVSYVPCDALFLAVKALHHVPQPLELCGTRSHECSGDGGTLMLNKIGAVVFGVMTCILWPS